MEKYKYMNPTGYKIIPSFVLYMSQYTHTFTHIHLYEELKSNSLNVNSGSLIVVELWLVFKFFNKLAKFSKMIVTIRKRSFFKS